MKKIKLICCMLLVFLITACSYERDKTAGSLEMISYKEALQMKKEGKTFNLLLTNDYCEYCKIMKDMLKEYLLKHHVVIYEAQLAENGKYLTMDQITKDFPEFKGTPDFYVIKDGKIKEHYAGAMNANEFDQFVKDHRLDEKK